VCIIYIYRSREGQRSTNFVDRNPNTEFRYPMGIGLVGWAMAGTGTRVAEHSLRNLGARSSGTRPRKGVEIESGQSVSLPPKSVANGRSGPPSHVVGKASSPRIRPDVANLRLAAARLPAIRAPWERTWRTGWYSPGVVAAAAFDEALEWGRKAVSHGAVSNPVREVGPRLGKKNPGPRRGWGFEISSALL
jgi:hypothetical protein